MNTIICSHLITSGALVLPFKKSEIKPAITAISENTTRVTNMNKNPSTKN